MNARRQVIYKLRTPYSNGTTHLVFDPVDFISKLAALVPPPKQHLVRYFGVFAPHYLDRKQVINKSTQEDSLPSKNSKKQRMSWARKLKHVFNIDRETCPNCGGRVRIISSIESPKAIQAILKHLCLDLTPPEIHPPRPPPEEFYDLSLF